MTTEPSIDELIEDAKTELSRLNDEAASMVGQSSGTDVVLSGGQAMKAGLAAQRADALRQRKAIEDQAGKVKELIRRKADMMRHQMDQELLAQREAANALLKQLEPLQEMVKRAEEGIWTINLYFGRDEEIVTLLNGDPAPLDTPIHIRQLVLAMDQEMAAAAKEGGLDTIRDDRTGGKLVQEVFDEWIKEPANLAQVLPDERGIVALRPRFDGKIYRDSKGEVDLFKSDASAKGAQNTYFLIRNGGMLYRTWTDFHIPIQNLTPLADEFTSFFERADLATGEKTTLEPESDAWEKAEKAAGYRERHFMRVALILEGLLRRTAVFHPVHPDLSFLERKSHRDGLIKIITDAEALLTTGRPEFYDWQQSIMEKARVGMRVVGYFPHSYDSELIRPRYSDPPEEGRIYTIDAEENHYWVIRYTPSRSYRTRRSSYLLPKDSRTVVIPDLAEVDDMKYYLGSRLNRHAYAKLFPALQSAIKTKEEEAKREAPFRQMLLGVLARDAGVEVAEVEKQVDDLISWYKLSAKWHKALVFQDPPEIPDTDSAAFEDIYQKATKSMSSYRRESNSPRVIHAKLTEERDKQIRSLRAQESKAVSQITAEYKSRRGLAEKKDATVDIVELAKKDHPDALLVGLRKDGRYVVFYPADERNVFVHEVEYNRHGRKFTPDTESKGGAYWRLPGNRPERSYQLLYTSSRWEEWDRTASATDHLTGPEYEQMEREWLGQLDDRLDRMAKRWNDRHKDGTPKIYRAVCSWYESTVHRFRAVVGTEEGQPPSARLITSQVDSLHYDTFGAYIKKTRSGVELDWDGYAQWGNYYEGRKEKMPWERDDLLLRDEAMVNKLLAQINHWRVYQDTRVKLLAEARGLIHSIEMEWVARAWAKEHSRFIDDYMDESLWPDHKKSIKIEFPYRLDSSSHHIHWKHLTPMERLVFRLVEDGVKLSGKTVKEALDMAKAHNLKEEDVEIPSELHYLPFQSENEDAPGED